jgi:hypothetical protein
MKKEKTVADKLLEHEDIKVPFEVRRFLGGDAITLAGDQACIGNGDSDYGSLEELRNAVEFYVKQLNGTVVWKDK